MNTLLTKSSSTFIRSRSGQSIRQASSNSPSEGSSPAVEAAQKKAQDALGGLSKLAESAVKFLGPLGERVGGLLGSYRQPVVYNLQVAREVVKQVYHAEKLTPPTSLSTYSNAYTTIWYRASNPGYWQEAARNGDLARVGIYSAEAYGIFKIGEIFGRRSLVGYKLH